MEWIEIDKWMNIKPAWRMKKDAWVKDRRKLLRNWGFLITTSWGRKLERTGRKREFSALRMRSLDSDKEENLKGIIPSAALITIFVNALTERDACVAQ